MTVEKTRRHFNGRPPEQIRRRDDRGEGVISAAIAVLIMAFIGVGMWIAFNTTFSHAAKHVDNQVNCIGQTNTSC
ncbi:MAG TPA: DUF4190 domain-containing protein [Acidimicrobiales bacterium]|nr:DUF4190 domain-containing protein [Acidimicrobiales bacterium]